MTLNKNIKNWLGYGTKDAKIWFLGMEEGGAEIEGWRKTSWPKKDANKKISFTLEKSLETRNNFSTFMDFKTIWEDTYNLDLTKITGSTVWKFIAAFDKHLSTPNSNEEVTKEEFSAFIDSKIDTYKLVELFPLPCPSKDNHEWIKRYKNCTSNLIKDSWKKGGRNIYQKDLESHRLNLLLTYIYEDKKVNLIIDYGSKYEKIFDLVLKSKALEYSILDNETEKISVTLNTEKKTKVNYILRKISFQNNQGLNREVNILETPFLGNGQISYTSIKEICNKEKIRDLLK